MKIIDKIYYSKLLVKVIDKFISEIINENCYRVINLIVENY